MTPLAPDRSRAAYWRTNLRFVGTLLVVWFLVSFGAGILWAERLDAIRIPGSGFGLGFWFAQQGSIYIFVLLIYIYVRGMNHIDRTFGVGEDEGAFPRGRPDLEDPDAAIGGGPGGGSGRGGSGGRHMGGGGAAGGPAGVSP
jgi:putative solute:sodium symporter small subunit